MSVFVKISWRDNGENDKDYYQHLANQHTGRFNLELIDNVNRLKVNGVTDVYDSFHFFQDFQEDLFLEGLDLQIWINGFGGLNAFDGYNVFNL